MLEDGEPPNLFEDRGAMDKTSIPRGLLRNVMVMTSGTGGAQLLGLLAAPLLARVYSPADFGILGIYVSLLAILTVIACLRYEIAIPIPDDDRVAAALFQVSLISGVVITIFMAASVLAIGSPLLHVLGLSEFSNYSWLLPIGLLLNAWQQAVNYSTIRGGRYGVLARARVSQSSTSIVTQLGLGLTSVGPIGLIIGQAAGICVSAATLMRNFLFHTHTLLRQVTREDILQAAKRYVRFPLFSSGAALLNSLGLQLPTLVLTSLFGLDLAGGYLLSQRIAGTPLTAVASSFTQVYMREIAVAARSSDTRLYPFYLKVTRQTTLVAAALMVPIALATPLFGRILGSQWDSVGEITLVLLPLYFFRFLSSATISTLEVLELNHLRLIREVIILALAVSALVAAYLQGWSELGTMASLSGFGSLGYGASIIVVGLVLRQRDATQVR